MKMTSVCRNLPTFAPRGHADTFTDFERLELHISAFGTGFEYLTMPSTGCVSAMFKTRFDIALGLHCTCKNLTCTVQILKVLSVKII